MPQEQRLEEVLRLGELCIEVLQQNEEHHAEVTPHWSISTNHRTAGPCQKKEVFHVCIMGCSDEEDLCEVKL